MDPGAPGRGAPEAHQIAWPRWREAQEPRLRQRPPGNQQIHLVAAGGSRKPMSPPPEALHPPARPRRPGAHAVKGGRDEGQPGTAYSRASPFRSPPPP